MKYWILLSLLILTGGCSQNTRETDAPATPDMLAVWSDDGSEIAIVEYEVSPSVSVPTSTETPAPDTVPAMVLHQIFLQNADGFNRRALTRSRPNVVEEMYYMRQAGYLVITSLDKGSGIRRFDRLSLNGNEILIIEAKDTDYQPCGSDADAAQVSHRIIPSPDGQQLARVYSQVCGQVNVEFMYANNLSFIDSQILEIDEPYELMWHPDGYTLLVARDGKTAWRIQPSQPAEQVPPPQCQYPLTTSSPISSNGTALYFEAGELKTRMGETAFGCQ